MAMPVVAPRHRAACWRNFVRAVSPSKSSLGAMKRRYRPPCASRHCHRRGADMRVHVFSSARNSGEKHHPILAKICFVAGPSCAQAKEISKNRNRILYMPSSIFSPDRQLARAAHRNEIRRREHRFRENHRRQVERKLHHELFFSA